MTGLEEIAPKPKDPKETLLHLAAKAGVMSIFKWLVDHGAYLWKKNDTHFLIFAQVLNPRHATRSLELLSTWPFNMAILLSSVTF